MTPKSINSSAFPLHQAQSRPPTRGPRPTPPRQLRNVRSSRPSPRQPKLTYTILQITRTRRKADPPRPTPTRPYQLHAGPTTSRHPVDVIRTRQTLYCTKLHTRHDNRGPRPPRQAARRGHHNISAPRQSLKNKFPATTTRHHYIINMELR